MTETELLPCPFCGSDATMEEVENAIGQPGSVCFSVGCNSKDEASCMGYQSLQTFSRRSDAVKAWNTRVPPSTVGAEDEINRDDPQFNQGVNHVVDLLAKTIGSTDWVAGDGSEDYDEDLAQTLLNILEARGLYDCDEGRFASLSSPALFLTREGEKAEIEETAIEIQTCPECCGTGFANHYLTDRNERECWKCKGTGEIAVDTNLLRAPPAASLIAKGEGK